MSGFYLCKAESGYMAESPSDRSGRPVGQLGGPPASEVAEVFVKLYPGIDLMQPLDDWIWTAAKTFLVVSPRARDALSRCRQDVRFVPATITDARSQPIADYFCGYALAQWDVVDYDRSTLVRQGEVVIGVREWVISSDKAPELDLFYVEPFEWICNESFKAMVESEELTGFSFKPIRVSRELAAPPSRPSARTSSHADGRKTLPEAEFDELVANRKLQIYRDWHAFAERARQAYREKGRGAFVIDLSEPHDPEAAIRYLTPDDAQSLLSRPFFVTSRTAGYNPESEIVFVFFKEGTAECTILRTPDGVTFPIVEELPELTAAQSLDELVQLLEDVYTRRGVEGLSGPARNVWRIMEAIWQIRSSGIDAYLSNIGPGCLEARRAFEEIGAEDMVQLYSAIFAKFPGGAPADDPDVYHDQLQRMWDEQDDDSDEYWIAEEERFLASASDFLPLLWRYWQARIGRE